MLLLPHGSPPPPPSPEVIPSDSDDDDEEEEKKRHHLPPPLTSSEQSLRLQDWFGVVAPESVHGYGGEWWSLRRFVKEVGAACGIPITQFDFDAHRIYTYFTPDRRPTAERDDATYRFLEWFGQVGFYIVWCWQRINLHRETPFTLWQLMDNRSLLTHFVALIQLTYTASVDDRGLKDPGRAGVRAREKQKQQILDALSRYTTAPPRDRQMDNEDAEPKHINKFPVPPRPPLTEEERFAARRHLLLKWCAQASGVNTTSAPYKLKEDKVKVRKGQMRTIVKTEQGLPEMQVLPIAQRATTHPPLLDKVQEMADLADATRANRNSRVDIFTVRDMDINVQQTYQRSLETLHEMSGLGGMDVLQIERRLVAEGSLRVQVFFAAYCSILGAQWRQHNHRSRLSGVVRHKLSKEWDSLSVFFSSWAQQRRS